MESVLEPVIIFPRSIDNVIWLGLRKGPKSIRSLDAEINSLEVGDPTKISKIIFQMVAVQYHLNRFRNMWSWCILNTSGSLRSIFYSFVVLVSTTKLWNMNIIGPLTGEIQVFTFIHRNVQCFGGRSVMLVLFKQKRRINQKRGISPSPMLRWGWYSTVC